MTAKDKAKELFDKYCHALRTEDDDDGYFTNVIHAKRCALITVNELICSHIQDFTDNQFYYWQEVKHEIENL